MKYLFILLSTFIIFSCQEENNREADTFLIKGKVNYLRDGYVKVLIRQSNKIVTLDSAMVKDDSTFELKGKVESPQYAQINFFNNQVELFPISNSEFEVIADANRNGGLFKISGTKEVELNNSLSDFVKSQQNKLLEGKQRITYAMAQNNQADIEDIRKELEMTLEHQKNYLKNFIDSLGTENVVAGFALVNYMNPLEDYDYFNSKAKLIEEKTNPTEFEIRFLSEFNNKKQDLENTIAQNKVKEEVEKKLAIGNPLPNIKLPNPDGKEIELSLFKGKVVLVDFWAGWCRPCRAENPNLVRAYNTYKSKGFEIYGVSLDRTKEQWTQAIQQDNITWPQVSDLKYWESQVVKEFNISGIPANFLIDKNGIIIAKDLRGEALESKLKEVL